MVSPYLLLLYQILGSYIFLEKCSHIIEGSSTLTPISTWLFFNGISFSVHQFEKNRLPALPTANTITSAFITISLPWLTIVICFVFLSILQANVSVAISHFCFNASIIFLIVSKLLSVPKCFSCAWLICKSCCKQIFFNSLSGWKRSVVAPNCTSILSACSI